MFSKLSGVEEPILATQANPFAGRSVRARFSRPSPCSRALMVAGESANRVAAREPALSFFDAFDVIRVINLPERSDRRREMEEELEILGLLNDPRVAFFPAIRPADQGDFTSVGARGVYESQKQLLAEAASRGQAILVLEDDCAFRGGAKDYVAPTEWDIFYGGYLARQPENLLTSDIEGAHMMGFSARGARSVATYLKNLCYEGIHPPIDAAYVWFRREYPSVQTVFAVPPLARQRASRSDIAPPKAWDRVPLLRSASSALRQLRNHLASGHR